MSREGWANFVENMIQLKAQGNLEQFARMVRTDSRTVRRWRRGEVDVSLDSLLAVSAGIGMTVPAVLKAAGILGPQGDEDQDDQFLEEEAQLILAAPLDEPIRRRLLRYTADRQERDKRARVEDLEFFLSLLH